MNLNIISISILYLFQALKANQENMEVQPNHLKKGKGRTGKRSVSEMSPNKAPVTRKRTAFGDITNVKIITLSATVSLTVTFLSSGGLPTIGKKC